VPADFLPISPSLVVLPVEPVKPVVPVVSVPQPLSRPLPMNVKEIQDQIDSAERANSSVANPMFGFFHAEAKRTIEDLDRIIPNPEPFRISNCDPRYYLERHYTKKQAMMLCTHAESGNLLDTARLICEWKPVLPKASSSVSTSPEAIIYDRDSDDVNIGKDSRHTKGKKQKLAKGQRKFEKYNMSNANGLPLVHPSKVNIYYTELRDATMSTTFDTFLERYIKLRGDIRHREVINSAILRHPLDPKKLWDSRSEFRQLAQELAEKPVGNWADAVDEQEELERKFTPESFITGSHIVRETDYSKTGGIVLAKPKGKASFNTANGYGIGRFFVVPAHVATKAKDHFGSEVELFAREESPESLLVSRQSSGFPDLDFYTKPSGLKSVSRVKSYGSNPRSVMLVAYSPNEQNVWGWSVSKAMANVKASGDLTEYAASSGEGHSGGLVIDANTGDVVGIHLMGGGGGGMPNKFFAFTPAFVSRIADAQN
jgi:hypothetical protein